MRRMRKNAVRGSREENLQKNEYKYLECSNGCGRTEQVISETETVLCHMCTCMLVGVNINKPKDECTTITTNTIKENSPTVKRGRGRPKKNVQV